MLTHHAGVDMLGLPAVDMLTHHAGVDMLAHHAGVDMLGLPCRSEHAGLTSS